MTGKRALYRRKPCTETPCSVLYLVGIYNIRALFENREREEEIWKVIEIGKFEEETVGRIVGDIYKDLSVKLKSLLQIPSNLYI